ncbi:PREDICTED: ribonuclease P protein subunit p20-like [Atta cephalotes]|uniref:Ribonuclease P protein subunit p20 n=2 Tax=Atta TaxID=12956 RepID=A0A158N8X6_ATTCE|nr:PREDICTED: ribonuclease P protein subunit p20-like [Atta cephalotes]XP_018049285.1 PREDICTED: ribonuclease P protein subunit p20-like [Atta colombica]KYM82138.1 Ribonuclease P protein subunit p20 [Atta colombica]
MAEIDSNSGLNKTISEQKGICRKKLSLNEHALRKRQVFKFVTSDRDIYVNNKTPFKGQLYKCEKLLDKGASELVIHGLGAAVCKAASLALRLKEIHHDTLDLDVKTSTITLVDDLEALNDNVDDEINNRQNSSIHIRVIRRVPVAVLRSKLRTN